MLHFCLYIVYLCCHCCRSGLFGRDRDLIELTETKFARSWLFQLTDPSRIFDERTFKVTEEPMDSVRSQSEVPWWWLRLGPVATTETAAHAQRQASTMSTCGGSAGVEATAGGGWSRPFGPSFVPQYVYGRDRCPSLHGRHTRQSV